jgi:DNA repair protein RadA/Sms
MEPNMITHNNATNNKGLLDSFNQEKAAIFVKRENFKSNLKTLKTGEPLIPISADNWKYFDDNDKFIPQRLGTEVLSILSIKKGQNEALFYLGDNGGYKPAEQIIKQLISQLLGNRYNGYAERDTLTFIQSYLPEEKIKTTGIPKLTPLSEVEPEEVNWLWEPYLPFGKVSIVEGDPGLGKTFFSLAVAASISNGWSLIGNDGGMNQIVNLGKVLYLTAEDGLGDTLRPRLEKMGADVKNVIALEGKISPEKDEVIPVSLLDVEVLRNALIEVKPALIIIDPIQAYLGQGTNMSRAEEVRPLLSALGRLAEEFRCAVILIRHLTKSGKDKASYRGMGSIDFTAAARSVLLVGKDPDDETKRVIVQTKSSLAETGKSIAFTINDGKFEWLGHTEITAAEVLAPEKIESDGEEDKTPMKEARKYLIDSLRDGAKPAKELLGGVRFSGFSERTLKKAKNDLKIKSYKTGDVWYWSFPPDAEPEDE